MSCRSCKGNSPAEAPKAPKPVPTVRWLWVAWEGVPTPLRWLMRVGGDPLMFGTLRGCGCPTSPRWRRLTDRLRTPKTPPNSA